MGSLFAGLEEKTAELSPGQWGLAFHNKSMQTLAAAGNRSDFFFGSEVEFTIIGQLHATFILAEIKAGLLVVDQHVAHERIIYERLAAAPRGREAAQMLMQPLSLHLTAGEEDILIRKILLLNDLGFILERFGPRQYVLRSVPAGQPVDQAMFREMLERLGEEGEGGDPEAARQALLIMTSCKRAVKANTPLGEQEMRALLEGLRETRHPMTCPHGRPILYLLPYHRLLQAFGRSSG
jgi:DNA mismatch repair protein MutL